MSKLYVVATPIGNLEDISDRAKRILSEVDLVAAEDTRHTSRLLAHLKITTRLVAYHDHNEDTASQSLIRLLNQGKSVALVSDAGTPLIADPGYRIVKLAREEGIDVVPVPGPSALLAALSVAGLASDRFTFHGFLPAKRKAKTDFLSALVDDPGTMIFYESPHRVEQTLLIFADVFEVNRMLTVARELTKTYEQICYGSIAEINQRVAIGEIVIKGEFVLVLQGQQQATAYLNEKKLLEILLPELPIRKAADIASKLTGVSRKELYNLALSIKKA